MEKGYFTVKELAEYISLSTDTVYHWIYCGKIPHYKFGQGKGGIVRFDIKEIEAWLEKKKVRQI